MRMLGVWSLAPGRELDLVVIEINAWNRDCHDASAFQRPQPRTGTGPYGPLRQAENGSVMRPEVGLISMTAAGRCSGTIVL